jgi:hypothetical protein
MTQKYKMPKAVLTNWLANPIAAGTSKLILKVVSNCVTKHGDSLLNTYMYSMKAQRAFHKHLTPLEDMIRLKP